MELKEAAQVIRDCVGMQTVLDLYGYKPKHGFMVCPFHGDHDASLKVYSGDKGWHCYGCGRGGSVIDFVMEHDNCSFQTAVKAIDAALKLDLLSPGDPLDYDRERAAKRNLDEFVDVLVAAIEDEKDRAEISIRIIWPKYCDIESKPKRERTAREWTDLCSLEDEMLILEARKDRCDDLIEEVKTWRRMKRRQQARKAR